MNQLFDENDFMTAGGRLLDFELTEVLHPIFSEWMKKGYSIRQILALATNAIVTMSNELYLLKAMDTFEKQQLGDLPEDQDA